MDIYHIWCDLKPGQSDMDFVAACKTYLQSLVDRSTMHGYRITRRKLGLGSPHLGEFHIMLEFSGLAQLDQAFLQVSTRDDPVESFHYAVNSRVQNLTFSLYRDFPDANRTTGSEKF